jgi:DNA processing protein
VPDSVFWQALLTLDLHPHQQWAILKSLGEGVRSLDALKECKLLKKEHKALLHNFKNENLPNDVRLIHIEHESYPKNLKATSYPTLVLLIKGGITEKDDIAVGIVGTRKASPYGKAVARQLAAEMARAGVTVVSGGAYGIDAQAHIGALEAGGRTIAVVGNGLKKDYPSANREIFRKISSSGAIVSQFPLDAKPDYWRFPIRNTTIAGMTRAVVVVEAPEKSGALLSAKAAMEEGRHVFVTPAGIDSISHRGSFQLINDGATLLYSPEQIFSVLGIEKKISPQTKPSLNERAEKIHNSLTGEPRLVDLLSEELNIPAHELLVELTQMELEGLVARVAGGYIKV